MACPCTCERCRSDKGTKERRCGHPKQHGHVVRVPTVGGPYPEPLAVHSFGPRAAAPDAALPVGARGVYRYRGGRYVWESAA